MTDDHGKVLVVANSIRETYSGPWGLKASSADVIHDVGKALGVDIDLEVESALGDELWDWESEQPSPFTEGLSSLVTDGLAPGSTVPTAEIAGDDETSEWEVRRARFILDALAKKGVTV